MNIRVLAGSIPIPIDNSDFELARQDQSGKNTLHRFSGSEYWIPSGSGGDCNCVINAHGGITPHGGEDVGWVMGGSFSQTLSAAVQGRKEYTLSLWVGRGTGNVDKGRVSTSPQTPYRMALYASDVTDILLGETPTNPYPMNPSTPNSWAQASLVVNTRTVDPAAIGRPLKLFFSGGSSNAVLFFDDVELSVTGTPEPLSVVLMATIAAALALARCRK